MAVGYTYADLLISISCLHTGHWQQRCARGVECAWQKWNLCFMDSSVLKF